MTALTLVSATLLAITVVPALALSRSWWVAACYAILALLCPACPEAALSTGAAVLLAYGLAWAVGRSL